MNHVSVLNAYGNNWKLTFHDGRDLKLAVKCFHWQKLEGNSSRWRSGESSRRGSWGGEWMWLCVVGEGIVN